MAHSVAPSKSMLILLAALAGFGPTCTHLYLSALPSLAGAFDTDVAGAQLTLSAFVWGFAIGMLISGPLSDRIGRRPVLLGGLLLCLVTSIGCLAATRVDALALGRFLQGSGASVSLVIARASVRDVVTEHYRTQTLSYMSGTMAAAGALAPLAGGFLQAAFCWKVHFIALAALSAVMLLLVAWAYPETRPPSFAASARRPPLAGVARVLGSRTFWTPTAMVCLSYGCFLGIAAEAPFLAIGTLSMTPQTFGVSFLVVSGAFVAGALLSAGLGRSVPVSTLVGTGAILSTVAAVVGLALALGEIGFILALFGPMVGVSLACGLIIPNAISRVTACFPALTGTVSALLGFLQMSFGALVASTVGLLHDGTPVPIMAVTFVLSLGILFAFAGWTGSKTAESPPSVSA